METFRRIVQVLLIIALIVTVAISLAYILYRFWLDEPTAVIAGLIIPWIVFWAFAPRQKED